MRLIGSLMVEGRYNELLAVLDVESDTAEPWGENFKRRIEGRVRQHGPLWDEFMQVWQQMGCSPHEEDGHLYIAVRCLQVDHDFYGFFSWVNVENDRIRLILLERFDGTVEEYYRAVEERNERVQDYLDRWDSHQITRNDLRELMGLNPIQQPFFNESLPPEAIEEAREVFLRRGNVLGFTRNTIV